MGYRIGADVIVLLHVAFVAFVVFGALAVLRWPRIAWVHLPAAGWGALIELTGWVCPLTPLENRLRRLGGERGYTGGFIEHYIVPVLYPEELARSSRVALGLIVVALNAAVYLWLWQRRRNGRSIAG